MVENDDIFGDGVNVLAVWEGLAEPGICVSARVQEDAAGRLDLTDDLGEQSLKNIARSVHVYRVRLAAAENKPTSAPVDGAGCYRSQQTST